MNAYIRLLLSLAFIIAFVGAITRDHGNTRTTKQKHRVTRIEVIKPEVPETDVVLTPEDFAAASNLKEVDLRTVGINVPTDPLIKAGRFEGDIANLNSRTIHKFINDSNSFARAAIRDQWRRWPNGEIPYVLSSQYGSYSKQVIAKAFEEYRKKTCIRFVPRDESKHQDYIYINPDDGCYSLVGRTGGRQPVSLDSGCIQVGTVIHELMHASGFFHEQSRADRDDYIDIVTTNIQSDALDQFEKYSLRTITHLDLPYDYGSIMHYGPYAFSKNGKRTIDALKPGGDKMGQRDGFSSLDLQKLNKLYQCEASGNGGGDGDTDEYTEAPPTRRGSGRVTTRRPVGGGSSGTPKCENSKWQCFFWSKLGYCRNYRDYMRQYCPKDCDMCDELAGPASGDTRQPSSGGSGTDSSGGAPANVACRDSNDHCTQWFNSGYCERDGFEDFMRETCARSCGTCGDGSAVAPPPSPEEDSGTGGQSPSTCQDNAAFKTKCKTYQFWGFCTGDNEAFMRSKCPKSCKFC